MLIVNPLTASLQYLLDTVSNLMTSLKKSMNWIIY